MKWSLTKLALLLAALLAAAPLRAERTTGLLPDSLADDPNARYLRNRERIAEQWLALLPNQTVLQYAGSIGLFNFGVGWHYGRGEHWETEDLTCAAP